MYLAQDQLLETLIVAGLILMFIWWGFKSGFFWYIFYAFVVICVLFILFNIYNYSQTF